MTIVNAAMESVSTANLYFKKGKKKKEKIRQFEKQ